VLVTLVRQKQKVKKYKLQAHQARRGGGRNGGDDATSNEVCLELVLNT
jgi:hypothetical protein